jgi:DNA-binding MarR family transcriptional regulator
VIAAPKAQPTLSRLLRRMELKGLIQSRDAREGPFGRLLAWSITEAGKRALDETWAAFEAMWPALGQDDYDPAALREFIAAGKDMNLWFGNPDSPPDPRRKVVAKRAATRFRDALVALGELPAEEE